MGDTRGDETRGNSEVVEDDAVLLLLPGLSGVVNPTLDSDGGQDMARDDDTGSGEEAKLTGETVLPCI